MKRILLTADQAAQLAPLMHEAYQGGGTVFAQVQRAAFPKQENLVVFCHYIPAKSSKRLRAFLTKEAAKIAFTPKTRKPRYEPKTPLTVAEARRV